MSVNKDQVKKLYDATSQDYGIDSFETFVQSLNDDVKRKEFFDLANVKYDIGNTLEEFENNIGIKKKILAGQQPLEVQIEDPEDPKKKKKAEPVSLLEQFRVSLKPLTSFQSALPSQSEEKRKGLNYWSNLYSQSDNQLVLDAPKVSGVNLSKSDIDRLRKLNTNKDRYVEEAAITAAASGASASEQQIAKRDAAAKYDNLSKGNKVYVGTTTALGGVFVDKAKVKDGAVLPLGFQSDLDAELGKWDMKSAAKSDFKPPVQTFTTQRVKATNEFFLSPDYKKLSDDAVTNLQSLTTRTNLGELVVDKSKLRSWMSSQFKKYDGGDVGKNSYFTDMVQARLVDDLSFEIDRPEVIKQAGIEYERMYGKKMSDEAGAFQTEQIKKLINPINENYKNFADKYVSQARAEISKLNETYNSQVSELNSKYEDNDWITLWGTEFFGKIPQGQDPKKFIEDQYKKDFNALRNTYLTQHAAVSAKHKAELGNFEKEYKKAVGDLQKGVEFTGYGTDYGSKVKAAFTSAAKKVYKNKDDQRRAISESIGWVFPRALTSGVSNVVSSAATFLDDNLQAGWVGWLKDQTQDWADAAKLPSNPIQSWSDLLDPAKVQQNLGEQLPNLAVSIGAALATKRPVMMANLGRFAGAVAMGTAGTLTENIQRQGQILQDLISQGVDPSEASNKSRKIWRSAPIDIAINSFQMELLLGKIAKGSFLSRFATTAVGENLTEIPQEIRQTREEEQITGGAETPTKEIALSVLPTTTAMSLLGAGSGAVKTKEKFAPTWLNNIAAYPFNKIAEQVINSSKGAVQAANSMNAVNGIIRTDALETMNNVVEGVQAHVDLAKQNGLNKDQQTAYVTLMATAEDLKKKIEDAKANNAPQERVDQLSTQFTNASNAAATLLSEKSGNYAVVLDEDGDRIVMTHDQLEQSLADGNFQDGVRSGAISVDVNATVMSDERVKSILNTLSGLNSRFNQSLATYENESDMTKSLQQKLGIEDGAVQTPSTNAMTMVGKPVVQKLGDVEVVGDLKVMGGYLVIENDEMVRPIGLVEDVQNLSLAELNMVPAVQDQVSIQTKTGEEINIPSLITMYAGRMNPNALVKNIMAVAPNVNEESLMSAVLAVDNAVRNGQRLVEQEKKPGVSNPKLQVATAGIGKSYSGEKVAEVVAEVGDKTSKTLMQKVLDILSFNFIGQEIDLDELYEKDQAFAQRVEQMRSEKPAGNVEQSKRVFNSPENTPAIIIDDKVYDGYSRLAQQYINGQKTANAFVSTGSNGKKYTLETAQPTAQDARPDVQIDRSALTVNAAADVQRLKAIEATGAEDGATMNIDGTTYTGGGLVVPVISLNTTQEELTPEAIADFVEQNKAKLGNNKVFKVGLYKFPGSNKVSIDLNIVANRDQREMALDFARRAGQESLFDLDTFENVKTGATGETPMQFTDQQFAEIAKAFGENRMPNVFGEQGKTLAERLREKINAGVGDRVSRAAAALRATGIQIRMIEDPAEFERATSQFGGQKTTEGIFIADTGEILMNKALLDKGIAAGLVVWHEASHPIVNIIRNTNPELYTKLVAGLKQAAKTNAGIRAVEEWAESEYAEYGAFSVEDETIVETIAGITEGTIDINNIPVGIKQSIIEFINRIASLLGLGQILEDTDLGAFKKLAGDVANALRTGTDISEIIGAENVKEYGLNIGVPTQLKVSSIPYTKVSHKGGQYDLSFVSKEDIVDIESLIKDISAKGQNVWFWTADQLGRGAYFDKTINGEHYLDAGPSFALDPENRNRGIIWATGKGEKWVNDKIANSDYIFIISGSPTKSKLFNKRVAELTINRIKKAVGQDDSYRKFRTEVLAVSKITDLNNILNRHESFESLLASPDRKQMLIKFDEQKAKKGTPLKALLEGYDAFIDYNELRDGFYKENGFDLNDVMLVLKPTGYGGKSAHSTYENDVLGEVVGVPDKKINAFDIMTDEFKAQYASDMSRTEQSQVVAPYGAGVKKVQMSKGNRAVAQAMSDVNKQMTEDDQGNYVFYHYSNNDLKNIDPAKFGRNLATGRDERPGVGLSMYYTSPDVRETMVPSDYGYVVRIQKDNVYPFNEDPLELLPIAEREFNKKFPGQAFDLNKQVGFVTKVAADRGYKMTVAKWNIGRRNVLRAQTVEAMKPERFMSKKFEGGFMQEKINPKLDFVPNAKKRVQMSKGNRPVVGQISWERSPEGKGDPSISARNKVVTQAAADLRDGKITNEEYRATVSENSPILPITRFFEPASEAEVERSLDKNQAMKANTPVADGTKVGLRLDIPAYKNNNTWVVSVHEGDNKAGKAISYRNVARITDVRFGVEPKASLNIAAGLGKAPINRIYGKWSNIPGESMTEQAENAKALVQEIVDDPNYVQVGMNPFRHSYFYDRNTDIGRPIVSADEVIQVGGLVYAKNPVYGEWTDESYRVKGMLDAAGAPVQFSIGNRDNEIRQFIRENIGQYSPDEISQAIQDELGISKADADAMVASESKGQAPLAEEIQTFQAGTGEEQERAMADQFEGLAPEVESQIDDDARTYFAKTNKQTDEEVDNFIKGKDMADLADYVVSNPNIPGRVKIWMAAKVAKNLGRDIEAARANGDQAEVARLSEKQANIYNTFAREATELGQAVQAFVAFNDDPNAVNFFLNKILRQLKERGVESITDQQRSEIIGLMQAVSNARPGLPKNKAVIQLSHYLGRLAPVKLGDVLQSIWYAHILSGVTTQLKNIYANTTMLALELPIGATWQSMKNMSLMPYVYAFKGLGSGMFKGIVKGADILRGGITEKDANKFFGTEPVLEYFSWKQTKLGKLGGGAVGKFLDFPLFIGISPTALKMVGRALSGADAFFSTTAQEAMANMLAYNEAVAEGKSGITPNGYRRVQELLGNTKQTIQDSESTAVSEGFKPGTMEYKRRVIELVAQTRNEKNQVSAEEFGKRVTLTNEPEGFTRGVYQVATSIQQYMPIARVVIPFTRIVSNISEMIINYSPAGAYRALTGIKNPKLSFKFSPDGDNKLSDEARGELFLKSSMAIAAVALLMDNVGDDDDDWFDITGGGPTDFQKKYELMKGGWRPYTITLKSGKKISYADWPIAGALSGLGTMRDIQQYENEDVKKNESRLGLAAYGYATAFYDKSLIKGISDFVDLFRLKGKYGPDATSVEKFEKFMANQAKALSMTNFSQQVFKLIQEYNDDPIKEAKGWESLYRDLPVINDGLNPIIDVFGDPVTPSTSERLLPYMTLREEKKDNMISMLNKKGIFIGIPEQKPFIELDTRTEREMTRDELYRYRKMSGEYTKAILVNRLDDIKKAADRYEGEFKQKAWEKMIGNVVQAARKRAYVDLLMNKTTDINKMFEDLND